MIDYERGLYVIIEELAHGPHPLPLRSGFSKDFAYRVLGIYNPSESGECWLILSNDGDQMWFISQRHVRTYGLYADRSDLRIPHLASTRAHRNDDAATKELRFAE